MKSWHYINQAEVLPTGLGGLDTLSSTTQPVLYRKGLTPQAFQMNPEAIWHCRWPGRPNQARCLAAQLAQDGPDRVIATMAAIGECTIQAQQAIRQGDLVALGSSDDLQPLLSCFRLGFSTLSWIILSNPPWLAGRPCVANGRGLGRRVIALASRPSRSSH